MATATAVVMATNTPITAFKECCQCYSSTIILDVTIRASQRLPPKEFSTMELMESLVITCTLSTSICILSSRV